MAELHEHRIKRLKMRSMRRGIKEMDLILQAFAERALEQMSDQELSTYDEMLSENDQELYTWVNGQATSPSRFKALITKIQIGLPDLDQA